MKNITKFAILFLMLTTLVVLVACAGGNTETSTDLVTAPVTEADVTVSPDTAAPETLQPETDRKSVV